MKNPVTERDTVHLIIILATAMSVLCLITSLGFTLMGAKDLALVAIGAGVGSPGSLLALLAATNRGPTVGSPPGPALPVRVTNQPNDAIPVEETPPAVPPAANPTTTTEGEIPHEQHQ